MGFILYALGEENARGFLGVLSGKVPLLLIIDDHNKIKIMQST